MEFKSVPWCRRSSRQGSFDLSDPETGFRYLLPMVYFNYAVLRKRLNMSTRLQEDFASGDLPAQIMKNPFKQIFV